LALIDLENFYAINEVKTAMEELGLKREPIAAPPGMLR
jgi:hypothetical protein